MTFVFLLLCGILIALPFYTLFSKAPESNLIVQYTDETHIENLQKFLGKNGIKTFAKNMYSQGIVSRRGGVGANPSLHVVNSKDLTKARELTANFERVPLL
jgi:hypothetical protein